MIIGLCKLYSTLSIDLSIRFFCSQNRHDHSSTRGKANSLDEILGDLTLMKEYNFNAIRTAHYPNDPYLYQMADKLGLYVIDEANIECHGHYDMICREHSFALAMLDRVQRMVVRDQNHACIIGWSLGNEAGYSMNHKMLYGWIKGYDSSRFIQYEGANRPVWGQLPHIYEREDSSLGTDVICPMYPTIKEMVEWADVIAPSIAESRPFIMCGMFLPLHDNDCCVAHLLCLFRTMCHIFAAARIRSCHG